MKKLLTALVVSLLGIATFAAISLGGNNKVSADPADACVKVQQRPNGKGIDFNDDGSNARSWVKIVKTNNNCFKTHKFVIKTWFAPKAFDGSAEYHNEQWLYSKGETVTVKPGDNNWAKVVAPMFNKSCFYQVDLVDVTNGDGGNNPIAAAITGGSKDCRPLPVERCDAFNVLKTGANREVVVSDFRYTATNANLTKVELNWGDNSAPLVTPNLKDQKHTYAKDGTYNIVTTLTFTHKNKVGNTEVRTKTCSASVTFTSNPSTPLYSCDLLGVDAETGRKVVVNGLNVTALNGAVYKRAVIAWGDGKTTEVTNNAKGTTYTYAKDGKYNIAATAYFTVNGKEVSATGVGCTKQVEFTPEKPPVVCNPETDVECKPELPDTGAGSIIALFTGVSTLSGLAYKFILARRFGL